MKRTELSYEVTERLAEAGFPREFAELVGQQLNTDFTARMMLGYLRDAKPMRAEDVADEMLGILEFRDKCAEKQMQKGRRPNMDDLFIRGFRRKAGVTDSYADRLPALQGLESFRFRSHITFFTGENGSGKSTLLEALALACGLNPEGGTQNYHFHTYDDHSDLGAALQLIRGHRRPQWSYFLRAESFYNMATASVRDYAGDDLHAMSHGESFLRFIQDNGTPDGLFLLDEPEAALSPQRQLTLLIHLHEVAKAGAQFVIATHSPILLGTPGAQILSFDDGPIHEIDYEAASCCQITKLFLTNRERMLRQLLGE